MKLTYGLVLITIAIILGGCATAPSSTRRAQMENYQKEGEQDQLELQQEQKKKNAEELVKKKQRITQNWDKLRAGMTVDEVDNLIGIEPGIKNPLKLGEKFLTGPNDTCNMIVKDTFYVLTFGNQGCTLKDYRLK